MMAIAFGMIDQHSFRERFQIDSISSVVKVSSVGS